MCKTLIPAVFLVVIVPWFSPNAATISIPSSPQTTDSCVYITVPVEGQSIPCSEPGGQPCVTLHADHGDCSVTFTEARFEWSPDGAGPWHRIDDVIGPGPWTTCWDNTGLVEDGDTIYFRVVGHDEYYMADTSSKVRTFVDCQSSWPRCPEDPNDLGECDTMYVEPWPDDVPPQGGLSEFIRVPIYVTNDVVDPQDSIRGFVIPLCYTHTNPSAYCSVSEWWNGFSIISVVPEVQENRSIFRHLPSMQDPQIHNRMMDMNINFVGGWDFIVLDLDGTSHYWLNMVPTGSPDQSWWEGSRTLLATMTFRVQDSMIICIDTCFWLPNIGFSFYNVQAIPKIPRPGTGNPNSFRVCFGTSTERFVEVTSGPDQHGPSRSQVPITFFVEGYTDSSDTFNLTLSDHLGWDLTPEHSKLVLDAGRPDTVTVYALVGNVPLGVTDTICLKATSTSGPLVSDSACLVVTCDSYSVTTTSIVDVGNDQGRQIEVRWTSFPGSDPLVTHFTVFRRADSLLLTPFQENQSVPSSKDYPPGIWHMVGTYPAYGETLYSAVVPTLKDSTISEGMYWSAFFVRAGTDTPTLYFDSPVDSGYSLDNLSPSPPTGLLASHEPAVTRLTWSGTSASDFDYYAVYRDTLEGLTPSPSNRLGYTVGTTFADSTAELGRTCYYLASATDFSGNESDPSDEVVGVRYITGDATADGLIDIGDVVYVLNYLFRSGSTPTPLAAGDVTCDGIIDLEDTIHLLNYLFKNGPPPCEP
jgi:hypothetical protein